MVYPTRTLWTASRNNASLAHSAGKAKRAGALPGRFAALLASFSNQLGTPDPDSDYRLEVSGKADRFQTAAKLEGDAGEAMLWILGILATLIVLLAIGLFAVLYAFGRVQESVEEDCNEGDTGNDQPQNKL